MPKKSFETLTEPMFYLLMALEDGDRCGSNIAAFCAERSSGRVTFAPATLYTLLARFDEAGYIREISYNETTGERKVEGRMRLWSLTETGREAYLAEVERLRRCLNDAFPDGSGWEQPAGRGAGAGRNGRLSEVLL